MSTSSATLTSSDYVVLGMVGLDARSGYEIKQTVELSIRFFWTISPAQVYPSLSKLEQAGLLSGREDPRGNRPRRIYERTEAGTKALREWLQRPEPMPFELRDIAMVKLFFADTLTPDDARALLATVKARSKQQVARLESIRPKPDEAAGKGNIHPLLTLELGIAFHQAIVDVCTRFARRSAQSSAHEDVDDPSV